MKKRVEQLKAQLEKLTASPRLKLNKIDLTELQEAWGIYRIFIPRSEKTLYYIGKSKNIRRRLRNDLLTLTGSHTLKYKLKYKWNISRKYLVPYLKQCRVQYIAGKEEFSTPLEHFAIAVLEPELND